MQPMQASHYCRRFLKGVLLAALLPVPVLFLHSCKPENKHESPDTWQDTPYELVVPVGFPQPVINPNNPLTVNGVALGRKLFYEPLLSGNNTQSCASCHSQANSFSDAPNALSKGIDGMTGDKNSMALINLAWNRDFFWDGRRATLEEQILDPVPNPVEMHQSWKSAIANLQSHPDYPQLFKKAFNTETVDSLLVARAIAQFLKTIVVSETKFQKFLRGKATLTIQELNGFNLFRSDEGADCQHCHEIGTSGLMMDNYFDNPVQRFHNNGLDPEPPEGTFTGRALITGKKGDNGKFKTPTLLNIAHTAPYMHDGRFKTLEEVVDFYNSGVHQSYTLDPNMGMKEVAKRRFFDNGIRKLNLNEFEKADLVAFLKTLSDPSITTNPAFSKP